MKLALVTVMLAVITMASAVIAVRAICEHRELAVRVAQLEKSQVALEAQAQQMSQAQERAERYLAARNSVSPDFDDPTVKQRLERLLEKSGSAHSDGPARYIPLTNSGAMKP